MTYPQNCQYLQVGYSPLLNWSNSVIKLCVFDTPMRPTKCELIFVHIGIKFSDEKSSPSQTGHVLWNAYFINKLFLHCMCHLLCKHDGILKKLKIKSIKEVADNNETLILSTKNVIFPSTLYFKFQVSKQIKNDYSQKNALV